MPARWQIRDLLDSVESDVTDLDARVIATADLVTTKTSGGHPLQAAVETICPLLAGLTGKYAAERRAVGLEVQANDQMETAREWLRIG